MAFEVKCGRGSVALEQHVMGFTEASYRSVDIGADDYAQAWLIPGRA